jgi:hypothetical protein
LCGHFKISVAFNLDSKSGLKWGIIQLLNKRWVAILTFCKLLGFCQGVILVEDGLGWEVMP